MYDGKIVSFLFIQIRKKKKKKESDNSTRKIGEHWYKAGLMRRPYKSSMARY